MAMIKRFGTNRPGGIDPGGRFTQVSGSHILPSSPERIWLALNDPEVLTYCIKGCQKVSVDDLGEYHAEFGINIGPVSKKLTARLQVEETAPPARYTLFSVLKTRRLGKASGKAVVHLNPFEMGTRLEYDADIIVDGWFAVFGEDALCAAAGRYMELFFERFVTVLDSAEVSTDIHG